MAEALAAAQTLGGAIAVSSQDVGPNLKAAAEHDRVPFTVLEKPGRGQIAGMSPS